MSKSPEPFGDYQLEERIAVGGMAEVFRAELRGAGGFRKTVAIKRILPQLERDQEYISMLLDEARLVARLNHPNIVRTLNCGIVDGQHYIAMEFVDGVALNQALTCYASQRRGLPTELAIHIAVQILRALDFSHRSRADDGTELNVVHRDVSPHNVLLSSSGEVKLTDFGVAKAHDRLARTATGQLKGKLAYMAPEQVDSGDIDHRADQYAAGIVLFEMLCCERAYAGAREVDVFKAVLKGEVDDLEGRLTRAGAPPALVEVLKRALSARVEDRYPSCGMLAGALQALAPPPVGFSPQDAVAALVAETRERPAPLSRAAETAVLDDDSRPTAVAEPKASSGAREFSSASRRAGEVARLEPTPVRILTNPGSNISEKIQARYDIVLLPQKICVDGTDHDTRRAIAPSTVDGWIDSARRHPFVVGTTAADFVKIFQEALAFNEPLLAIMTSRKIIASYDAALIAVSTLEKLPGPTLPRIEVVDSRGTDVAAGLLVLLACQAREHGLSLDHIVRLISSAANAQRLALTLDTLDRMVKGGRASFLRAWLGNVLGQRPMISFVDGALSSVGRYSTRDNRCDRIVEFELEKIKEGSRVWIGITHGADPDSAEELLTKIRAVYDVEYAYVQQLSSSIYLHCGPKALAVTVLPLQGLPWQPPPLPRGLSSV